MNRTIGTVAVFVMACAGVLAAGQAQDDYAKLLGAQEKALEGKGSLAASEFAAKALAAAKANAAKKDLQALLCTKAYEYGMKDSAGYPTAIEAMRLLLASSPGRKPQAQEGLARALAASFRVGEKARGNEALTLMIACGERYAAADQASPAAGMFRDAAALAKELPSMRAAALEAKALQLAARAEAQKAQAELKARLEANPKDAAARMELIALCVGALDEPKTAQSLVTADLDEATRKNVPLAARPATDLAEGSAFELAGWYLQLAQKASGANKAALLAKAQASCRQFLALHAADDQKSADAKALLAKASEPVVPAGAWLTSFPEAAKAAKAANRPILVDFTGSDWCVWCQRLKAEVFDTPAFKDWAGKNVILLELDFPQAAPQPEAVKAANAALAKKYNIEGFPTILFLTADGKVVGQSGYRRGGPDGWIANAQRILAAAPKGD